MEFKGDAEVHWTSWPVAGALVSTPAQAASKDRQLMTAKVRSALKEKEGGNAVMKKMAGIRGSCQAYGQCTRENKEPDNSTRWARKSFKKSTTFSIKKAASGFPEAAFGFS
ncbi:hypothetical protein ACEN8I_06020 [Polaromonas sp. CT11-55]|uniref:hypothetical protein n=1 Tax=Polaromonas sp. CT11-55 TaxID=3243045 RepID=UPI0039A6314C